MTRYAIGLGSNLGDRLAHLRQGVQALGEIGEVEAVSGLYETDPVGGPDQDPFLNAVVLLETELKPREVLERLLEIEREEGRERTTRWGPRTLDLDIITSDLGTVTEESLEVPHPRAQQREFVLRPLVDVWPEAPLPGGVTAAEALVRIDDQGVDLLARSWLHDSRLTGLALVGVQFVWFIGLALALAWDGSLPEGDADPMRILGMGLAAVGAGLAFVASRRLGRTLTPTPEPVPGADLIETGPYRLARHPIYGGVILFSFGTALVLNSLAGTVLALGLLPFFYFKSLYEERRLRMAYADYSRYRRRVPRRLIPFVL
ncbi:MAG: 2-amino-4-hydroxy-6-hydroxymethyldihydropteridine diphosphokinase [Acidimicrobiia bacterium]